MSAAESEAEKAAEMLDLGGTSDDANDAQDDAESETETEESSTNSSDEPTGLDRLTRTDVALDLDKSTDWWDPRGKGGINRIGAAIQQMGGWQYVMPVVWLCIGFLEVLFLLVTEQGLVVDDDGEGDEGDAGGDSETDEEGEESRGGDPAAGGEP